MRLYKTYSLICACACLCVCCVYVDLISIMMLGGVIFMRYSAIFQLQGHSMRAIMAVCVFVCVRVLVCVCVFVFVYVCV